MQYLYIIHINIGCEANTSHIQGIGLWKPTGPNHPDQIPELPRNDRF